MSEQLLLIDVSNPKYESYDSIKIEITNDEDIYINFSKLVSQSKYVLDNYKYSEALNTIPMEIKKIREEHKMNSESIKYFIQLIQYEKVNIPIESYKDIYTLSEYFNIPKFTEELDKIREKEVSKDLSFSIQILLDSEKTNDRLDTKLTIKIENFLSKHINECIENPKFKELPVSTIFRILESSEKGSINSNSLFEFIIESAATRFILFKFVELQKLTDEQIEEFIKFIENQDEETREMYLECIHVNLSFIIHLKNMKNKYDQLLNELKLTKEEINEVKHENEQEKVQHKKTKDELKQTRNELNQINDVLIKTKDELNKINEELQQTKEELDKCKREFKQAEDEINRLKNEKAEQPQAILVGGQDKYFVLGEKPNNKNDDGYPLISPPVRSLLNPSSLLSFSSYSHHSVVVTRGGSLMGVGNNKSGQISSSLSKSDIDNFSEFCIKDGSGHQLVPVSAVCSLHGTLYMLSQISGSGRQLVLCDCEINGGNPVFLDIGNHEPVSLFGGHDYAAAIGVEGEVIFINRYSLKNSPSSRIKAVSLPDDEKASSIAFCSDSVVVLSSNGRVFEFTIKNEEGNVLKFSTVSELAGEEIVCVSGVRSHFLAVNKEGSVFGRGSNECGELGLEKGIKSSPSFTEILSLRGYEIYAAYAGYYYSLFQTREGKILACGNNCFSQLFLSSGPGEHIYSPTETTIRSGATFCITGDGFSAIFIGIDPPTYTPNKRIDQSKYHYTF